MLGAALALGFLLEAIPASVDRLRTADLLRRDAQSLPYAPEEMPRHTFNYLRMPGFARASHGAIGDHLAAQPAPERDAVLHVYIWNRVHFLKPRWSEQITDMVLARFGKGTRLRGTCS